MPGLEPATSGWGVLGAGAGPASHACCPRVELSTILVPTHNQKQTHHAMTTNQIVLAPTNGLDDLVLCEYTSHQPGMIMLKLAEMVPGGVATADLLVALAFTMMYQRIKSETTRCTTQLAQNCSDAVYRTVRYSTFLVLD